MPSNKVLGAVAVSGALAVGALFGATLGNPATSGASTAPASSTTVPAQGSGHGGPGGQRGPGFGRGLELDAAAKAIGITTDQLRTELKAGKTIAAVAKENGVDRQKVIDAMVTAGEKRLDEAKAALPEAVAHAVDGTRPDGSPDGAGGGMGHRGEGGPGRPGRGEGLAAAAKALGMTEADLGTALRGGKTLAQVAKDKGVPVQKVIDALVAEAKTKLAEAVKAGKITRAQADERLKDLTARITDRINGAGRPHD